MPKTNHEGSTYYGHTGIVDHADGKLSQLDPSINYDGTVVDGFESDERELEEQPGGGLADSTAVRPVDFDEEKSDEDSDGEKDTDESEDGQKARAEGKGRDAEAEQGKEEEQPKQSSAPEPRARRTAGPSATARTARAGKTKL